jgi:hypothetical protein
MHLLSTPSLWQSEQPQRFGDLTFEGGHGYVGLDGSRMPSNKQFGAEGRIARSEAPGRLLLTCLSGNVTTARSLSTPYISTYPRSLLPALHNAGRAHAADLPLRSTASILKVILTVSPMINALSISSRGPVGRTPK